MEVRNRITSLTTAKYRLDSNYCEFQDTPEVTHTDITTIITEDSEVTVLGESGDFLAESFRK